MRLPFRCFLVEERRKLVSVQEKNNFNVTKLAAEVTLSYPDHYYKVFPVPCSTSTSIY